MTFDEWLEFGVQNGYCSPQYCATHDVGFITPYEEQQFDDGYDPCVHVVRLGSLEDWDTGD